MTMDKRPYRKSYKLKLFEKATMFTDNSFIRSIRYNRTLFAINPKYFGDHGLYMLTLHYVHILYTLEVDYKLLKLPKEKLKELKEYVEEFRSPFNFTLKPKDIEMFKYASSIIPDYIDTLNKQKLWKENYYEKKVRGI